MRQTSGALLTVGALLLALPLTGCNSSKLSCRGPHCTMTFSGGNGAKWVDVPHAADPNRNRKSRTWFRYQGVRDGRATVIVGNDRGECVSGQRLRLGGLDLTCTRVTGDSVTLDWTWPNRY